jgi:hypothetical protein
MGLLDKFGRGWPVGATDETREDTRYLANWARTHHGVEAFVEPRTTVSDISVVLVAASGEWTRRFVGDRGARQLARETRIPVYDVRKTGYPTRMRDHNARRNIERKRQRRAELDQIRALPER